MKHYIFGLFIVGQLLGCKSEDAPIPANQNVEALKTQFEGKYRITSAISSEPLDVNLDGLASVNLLTEIDALLTGTVTDPYLRIDVFGPSTERPTTSFILTQAWPEQFVRMSSSKAWNGIDMISFNPAYGTAFDMKVVSRELAFSEDFKQLLVISDQSEEPYLAQSSPKSILVQSDGKIVLVALRKIYTSLGVREVTVTTTYERFTTTT